jgi:hypothetical protein
MKTNIIKLTCGLALLGAAATASAQSLIDIQFNSDTQQTGAAVIGQSGDYWNQLTTDSGTSSLLDSQGASSGVSFTWASSGIYSPSSSFGGGDASLMGGYVINYIFDGSQTMSFANLSADASYTLYIYTQGDSYSNGRETSVTVSGTTYTTTPTDATATTFIAGQNYLEITGTTDGSGNLQFTYQAPVDEANGNQADINGIQLSITSVPEPSTLALAALGGLGMLWQLRRRK